MFDSIAVNMLCMGSSKPMELVALPLLLIVAYSAERFFITVSMAFKNLNEERSDGKSARRAQMNSINTVSRPLRASEVIFSNTCSSEDSCLVKSSIAFERVRSFVDVRLCPRSTIS